MRYTDGAAVTPRKPMNLTVSQRGMKAARMSMMPTVPTVIVKVANERAAKEFDVSVGTTERARRILKLASQETIDAIDAGDTTVNEAVHFVGMPERRPKLHAGVAVKRQYGEYWIQLRDALEAINSMPDIETSIKAVPANMRDTLTRRLVVVRRWLDKFDAEWQKKITEKDDD